MKKRVVIVHGQLTHGGSERQLFHLLRHRDCDQVDASVVLSGARGYWEQPIADLGVPITLLEGSPLQKLWQFRRFTVSERADTVLSWSSYTNPYALAVVDKPFKRVGSFRNVRVEDSLRFRRANRWAKLKGLQSVICNSQATYDALRPDLGPNQQLFYVPNGTDPIEDRPGHRLHWRRELGVSDDEQLIVGVGRLAPQKNFARFIDVVAAVHSHRPQTRAVIVGPDMGLGPELANRIDKMGLPAGVIRLVGEVDDARHLMCAADVFLLSSNGEGMPNVVMEAMAAKVPCVTTPVNGVAQLMDNRVHGIIGDWTVDSLAKPIIELLDDGDFHARVAAQAEERILGEFSPQRSAERIWGICL